MAAVALVGALTRTELDQLPICCPGLTSLGLIRALQHDVGLDLLLKLSGLTSLAVEHGPPDDALDVLQQLTILRSLRSLSVGEHLWCELLCICACLQHCLGAWCAAVTVAHCGSPALATSAKLALLCLLHCASAGILRAVPFNHSLLSHVHR
jgi:ABC-type antimicrobial peptide transport system ATPase subunit